MAVRRCNSVLGNLNTQHDIDMINHIETRAECLFDRTMLPFLLSYLTFASELDTLQTGDDDFCSSLLCLKKTQLDISLTELVKNVLVKVFHT